MNKNFQTIALSKRYLIVNTENKIDIEDFKMDEVSPVVIQIQAEVMRYGFMFSTECVKYLNSLSEDELTAYAKDINNYLVDAYGDNGMYASLFGNFPFGVMEMSETEFFLGQIIHYLTGADMRNHMTTDDAEMRVVYASCLHDEYKMIEPISMREFVDLFKNILSSSQSLTAADKENVEYLCKHYKDIKFADGTFATYDDVFPEEIPFKETLCVVACNLDNEFKFNSITDILRIAVYLSDGDICLPAVPKLQNYMKDTILNDRNYKTIEYYRRRWGEEVYNRYVNSIRSQVENRFRVESIPFKFKKFKRAERRNILAMIEKYISENSSLAKQEQILEDMKKYRQRWIRLGEVLHPGEYCKKYPKTCEMFVILRNAGTYISTYAGRVENARKNGNIDELLALYMQRPGEFGRNIDNLIRNYPGCEDIVLDALSKAAHNISTKMIYELLDHFYLRNTDEKLNKRYVVLKGDRKIVNLPSLEKMNEKYQSKILDILYTELVARFAAKDSLEGDKYFLDPALKNIMLPKNMRSMNFAVGQLPQGTKYNLKNSTGILRFYCRWEDPDGTRDLDLSASLYTDDYRNERPNVISWNCNNYNSSKNNWWVFSGDVRHRVGKCAEYIDINIEGAKRAGYKHLILSVNDFNNHGFLAENAYCGVMERDQLGKRGDTTWAPDTVTLGFRLTSPSVNIVGAYINLEDLTMTIVDEDYAGVVVASYNNDKFISVIDRYLNYDRFFNVYSLIETNIQARDGRVEESVYSKTELKESIKKLKELKEFFLNKLKEDSSENVIKAFETTEDYLAQYQYVLDHTISFDDISRDYTTILEWMF